MACFIVPATEAVVTTIVEKAVASKEKKESVKSETPIVLNETKHVPFSRKLKWLNTMLWGGSALLAFEHLWHGEISYVFPFLTAAGNSADRAVMLHEMATVGVTMAISVTAVWVCMVAFSNMLEKRTKNVTDITKVK